MRLTPRFLLRLVALCLAAAALVPLLGADPAVLALLLDADFLVLTGAVGLTMLGTDARVLTGTLSRSLPVLWVRVGLSLTRSSPFTLIRGMTSAPDRG